MVADSRDVVSGGVTPDSLFHELGCGHCWEVLELLMQRSCTVSTIADALELDVSEISKSLRRLHDLGLVEWHQVRKHRMYALSAQVVCLRSGDEILITINSLHQTRLSISVPMH